jgi:murein DD-endopeptidase MepM/ murein hydrolase activator NlpD
VNGPANRPVNRKERWQYRLQEWRKKLLRRHEHGWKGVSVLIYPHHAGSPYRIRINYYALLFPVSLIAIVIGLAGFYEVKRVTIDRDRYEKLQTSEILLSNHHIVLSQKTELLHRLEEQRDRLYRLSWNQKPDPDLNEHLQLRQVEEKILNTGSRFDLDLERYRQYRQHADLLLLGAGQAALKSLWHRVHIYWITPKGWPVYPGTASISSGYGSRMDPFLKTVPGDFHGGVDFAAAPNTPIIATAPGTVVRSVDKDRPGFGLHVVIHHGLGYQTLYAHCNKVLVKAGDRVQKGQVIALIGRTGRATGNHLHYEVRFGLERPVDPVPYISFK